MFLSLDSLFVDRIFSKKGSLFKVAVSIHFKISKRDLMIESKVSIFLLFQNKFQKPLHQVLIKKSFFMKFLHVKCLGTVDLDIRLAC